LVAGENSKKLTKPKAPIKFENKRVWVSKFEK